MKFLREFRDFAMKGSVVDLAIGVIIGASFGKIVTSLVNDIIMPPVGLLLGGVNFGNLFVTLSEGKFPTLEAAKAAGAVTLNYGAFLNTILDFVIVAFCIFIVIRQLNRFRKTPAAAVPEDTALLREIRDILKTKKNS